jgi:mRNA interferase MazF
LVTVAYVPGSGELIWISLDPVRGREQAGRRPFVVLSPREYNAKTSLVVGVPVTSKRKGYPFEVPLRAGRRIFGIALVDQLKSLDWRDRYAEYAEDISPHSLRDIRALISTFLALR